MGIVAGVFFGFNMSPVTYITEHYENASKNVIDMLFSMYTGITVVGIFYFIIYYVYKKATK